MNIQHLFEAIFLGIGLYVSILQGKFAVEIFLFPPTRFVQTTEMMDKGIQKMYSQWDALDEKSKSYYPWRIYQFWINFIGCFIGWLSLAYLIFVSFPQKQEPGVFHITLLIIGVVGIMGFLPNTVSRISGLK